MRRTLPTLLLLLTGLPAGAAEIHADGSACTLADAILAANADSGSGGCPAGSGGDTLILDADVTLTAADTAASTSIGGAFAGLPDVTSEITIRAGLASLVQRDPSFGCEEGESDPAFRILNVRPGASLTLDGLTFAHGCVVASGVYAGGGALHVEDAGLVLRDTLIRDSTVRGDYVITDGGGAFLDRSSLDAERATFVGNLSSNSDGGGYGGAITQLQAFTANVRDSTFEANAASGTSSGGGGAIYLGSAFSADIDVSFSGSSFLGNVSTCETGACAGALVLGLTVVLGELPAVVLRDSILADNVVQAGDPTGGPAGSAYGGALAAYYGVLSVENTLFARNTARATPGSEGAAAAASRGGALFTYWTDTYLDDVSFVDNRAVQADSTSGDAGDAYGGAIGFLRGPNELRNVTLVGNVAQAGSSSFATGAGGDAGGGAIDTGNAAYGADFFDHLSYAGNQAVAGTGGDSGTAGQAEGGALRVDEIGVTQSNSAFENNVVRVGVSGPATSEDCHDVADRFVSTGYNVVPSPGNCSFDGPADLPGQLPGFASPGDDGCLEPLADGTCLPVLPLTSAGSALDGGSCAVSGATADARGFARPVDLSSVAGPGDGCDAGAYEAQDGDGDGVIDAEDLCLGDDATGDADSDGECADVDPDDTDPVITTTTIFADDFESGETGAWSDVAP